MPKEWDPHNSKELVWTITQLETYSNQKKINKQTITQFFSEIYTKNKRNPQLQKYL